jgi:hypothetical protein
MARNKRICSNQTVELDFLKRSIAANRACSDAASSLAQERHCKGVGFSMTVATPSLLKSYHTIGGADFFARKSVPMTENVKSFVYLKKLIWIQRGHEWDPGCRSCRDQRSGKRRRA